MATGTIWSSDLLDEVADIVEAEWMRLQQLPTTPQRDSVARPAEEPASRQSPAKVGTVAGLQPKPRVWASSDRDERPMPRSFTRPVWPTQRSPPAR